MNAARTIHPAVRAIADLLQERGISKSELARQLGWSRMQVQRRLLGESQLTVAELEWIAHILDVPLSYFLPTSERVA